MDIDEALTPLQPPKSLSICPAETDRQMFWGSTVADFVNEHFRAQGKEIWTEEENDHVVASCFILPEDRTSKPLLNYPSVRPKKPVSKKGNYWCVGVETDYLFEFYLDRRNPNSPIEYVQEIGDEKKLIPIGATTVDVQGKGSHLRAAALVNKYAREHGEPHYKDGEEVEVIDMSNIVPDDLVVLPRE